MKRIFYILVFLMVCTTGHATHNRAGQLLYRHISGYTYEFTEVHFFQTYIPGTNTPNSATEQRKRDGLYVSWGDNRESQMPFVSAEELPDNYTKCLFRMRHTYDGPGTYTIILEDKNRNEGVLNIPNSVGVYFCVKTIFRINPNTGINNTPELLTYPIDKAAVGRRFVHNPSAHDADGDSLSYEIAICLRDRGIEIETYSFPESSNIPIYVDERTGDFVWDAPVKKGLYNVAMRIIEWRHDGVKPVKISSILRDMQIEVVDTDNMPPVFDPLEDICVLAGDIVNVSFKVTDPDNDRIKVTATGGPYEVLTHKAAPIDTVGGKGYTNISFTWETDNSHVRKQPYTVVFKAEDQNRDVKLVSFAHLNITVIAPKVEIHPAVAERKEILLEWNPSECNHASGYEIYRSIGKQELNLKPCDTGIPAGAGYEKVATLNGINNTIYRDNNNGRGLSPGIEYCYRIVAIFSDGAKSLPSDETCASLLAGTPPMIRAHVEIVDVAGEIEVKWLEKPVKDVIDKYISNNPGKTGPFEYRLFHTLKIDAGNWTQLGPPKSLGDTVFVHERVDTKNTYPHFYKVELWDQNANVIVDEDFEIASTLYPILQPSDKAAIITFGRLTPWVNTEYDIYRCIKTGQDICIATELVGRTDRETYTDVGLKNGLEYCYRIESKGFRYIDGIEYKTTNWSHVACVTPEDNVPPCAPELTGESICHENRRNQLDWTYIHECMYDVKKFLIYFSFDGVKYELIGSIDRDKVDPYKTDYSFSDLNPRVGTYYVAAVDSAGNESQRYNTFRSTPCSDYELPNVFTPNNDGFNDVFKSYYPQDGLKRSVDMKIYNRSGKLVFKTNEPDINWDGRDIDSKRFVPSSVYLYTCELYEEWSTGERTISLSGFIHVYHGDGPQQYIPPEE